MTIVALEDQEQLRIEKIIRGMSVYLLSGAAAFSLEVVVYVGKGWLERPYWWLTTFLGVGIWLVAPYAGLSALILKKKHTLRQLVLLLFGSLGIVAFGIFILLDGFFVHNDPRSWIIYVLVPIYQWIAVAATAGIRYSIGLKIML